MGERRLSLPPAYHLQAARLVRFYEPKLQLCIQRVFCQSICFAVSDTDLELSLCQEQVRRGRAPSCSDSSHQVAAGWGCCVSCVSPVLSHSPGFGRLSFGKLPCS